MSDVKATEEGRMVQRRIDAMIPMKMMAFLGCPFLSTLPIQLEPGKIPSRAIANTRREAAVMARLVFYKEDERVSFGFHMWKRIRSDRRLTMKRPMMATMVMTIPPPRPIAR
jgi:hypothetical protein